MRGRCRFGGGVLGSGSIKPGAGVRGLHFTDGFFDSLILSWIVKYCKINRLILRKQSHLLKLMGVAVIIFSGRHLLENLLNNRMIEARTRFFCKRLTVTPHIGCGEGFARFMHFENPPDSWLQQKRSLLKTVFFQ